ncbi:hypothetical protein AB6O49_26840 [Streptomyces sp. SBR177]
MRDGEVHRAEALGQSPGRLGDAVGPGGVLVLLATAQVAGVAGGGARDHGRAADDPGGEQLDPDGGDAVLEAEPVQCVAQFLVPPGVDGDEGGGARHPGVVGQRAPVHTGPRRRPVRLGVLLAEGVPHQVQTVHRLFGHHVLRLPSLSLSLSLSLSTTEDHLPG